MESKSKSSLRPDTPLPVQPDSSKLQGKQRSPLTSELLIASRRGHASEVKRLLAEGGGSLAQTVLDKHGRNCLHLACHYGKLETVQVIMNMEVVTIDCTSKRGFTPLHEASGEGHVRVVFYLLAMGAYLKARSSEGWTALMSAAYNGHVDVAKILIAAGLNVNATNKHGYTALHVAAWRGDGALVEVLIKEGALITMTTSSNKTALDIAEEENHHEAVTVLKAASSRESEKPFYRIAALEGQLKVAEERLIETQEKQREMLKKEREEMTRTFEEMKAQLIQELTVTADNSNNGTAESAATHDEKLHAAKSKDNDLKKPDPVKSATANSKPVAQYKNKLQPPPSSIPIIVSPLVSSKRGSLGKLNLLAERKVIDTLSLELQNGESRKNEVGYMDTYMRRSVGEVPQLKPTAALTGDKVTITQMVEESLLCPGTMASIRKQLKEDELTPKLQKKFGQSKLAAVRETNHRPSNMTTPPVIQNHSKNGQT